MKKYAKERFIVKPLTFKLNDNSLLLVTTVVDPCYRLSVFPSKFKEQIGKPLQMWVKKYSRCEVRLQGDSLTYQPPKSQNNNPQINLIQKFFLGYILLKQRKKQPRRTRNKI